MEVDDALHILQQHFSEEAIRSLIRVSKHDGDREKLQRDVRLYPALKRLYHFAVRRVQLSQPQCSGDQRALSWSGARIVFALSRNIVCGDSQAIRKLLVHGFEMSNLADAASLEDARSCVVVALQMLCNAVRMPGSEDVPDLIQPTSPLCILLKSSDERISDGCAGLMHNCLRFHGAAADFILHPDQRQLLFCFLQCQAEKVEMSGNECSGWSSWTMFALQYLLKSERVSALFHAVQLDPKLQLLVLQVVESLAEEKESFLTLRIRPLVISIAQVLSAWTSNYSEMLVSVPSDRSEVLLAVLETCLSTLSLIVVSDIDGISCPIIVELGVVEIVYEMLKICSDFDTGFKRRSRSARAIKLYFVQLFANLSFQSLLCRDRIGEVGGVELLLGQCMLDENNPYLREWVMLTLRN